MTCNNNSIQSSRAQKIVHTVRFSAWETEVVVNIAQVLAFGRGPKQYLSYFACCARKLCKVESLSILSLQCWKALLMLHVLHYIAQVKLQLLVTFSIGTLSQKRFDDSKVTNFFFFAKISLKVATNVVQEVTPAYLLLPQISIIRL